MEFALNERNALPAASKTNNDNAQTASTSDRHALDVFHALGKLLYAKRSAKGDEKFVATENGLPAHLRCRSRPMPLDSDPDDVVTRCHLSGEKLTSFLHENELDFAASLESVQRVLNDISLFDASSRQWDAREDVVERFGGLVAAKSVAYWNYREGGQSKE